jgi:putative flippase GtrA
MAKQKTTRKKAQKTSNQQSKSKLAQQKRMKRLAIQFFEYMVTGGVWFWSGYIIIVTLDNYIGLFWANLLGNGVGITLNFLLERFWVFRTKKQAKLGLIAKRYIIYTVLNAFILNYFILEGLRRNGIEPEIGQFLASGFFTIWNYFWYKYWVFNAKVPHNAPRRTRHHA